MTGRHSRFFPLVSTAFLTLAALTLAAGANAQAPPGPISGAPSRDAASSAPSAAKSAPHADAPRTKNLAGSWKLNLDESDDPTKKLQQARDSDRGNGGTRRSGGMGGGWPGGTGWPGSGGRGGYGGRGQAGESDSDREKMHNFLEAARELTVTQKDPEIDFSDDSHRCIAAFTDGRKIEKSKDPNNQQFDAKWDDYRLTMEGKDPKGNKYERSYEVLEGNQQLRETLLLKVGRNNTEVSIRYIYDLVSKPPAAANTH